MMVAAAAMLFTGCADDPQLYSANENFDMLWRTVDEHYCFFEYKNIDWNENVKIDRSIPGGYSRMSARDLFSLFSN